MWYYISIFFRFFDERNWVFLVFKVARVYRINNYFLQYFYTVFKLQFLYRSNLIYDFFKIFLYNNLTVVTAFSTFSIRLGGIFLL